jgi:hypothetical protein
LDSLFFIGKEYDQDSPTYSYNYIQSGDRGGNMGGVFELFIVMLIIGAAAFAPLGYFIYKFTQKNGKPFGETEPHGDSPSIINDFAENALAFIKKQLGSKGQTS